MSLFSWLFPAKKPAKPLAESSGLSRMEPTRPVQRRQANGHDHAASRSEACGEEGSAQHASSSPPSHHRQFQSSDVGDGCERQAHHLAKGGDQGSAGEILIAGEAVSLR